MLTTSPRRPLLILLVVLWTGAMGGWAALRERSATRRALAAAQEARARLMGHIHKDLVLLQAMAQDPAVLRWCLREHDPDARREAAVALNRVRVNLSRPEVFAALESSRHFYFMGTEGRLDTPAYTLQPGQRGDAWYTSPGLETRGFTLNVDEDRALKVTRLWFNIRVQDRGRKAGVVGGGLDLDAFLESFYRPGSPAAVLMSRGGDIQLHPDRRFTLLNAAQGRSGGTLTIRSLVRDLEARERLQHTLEDLAKGSAPEAALALVVDRQTVKAGVLYLPELDWFLLTLQPVAGHSWLWLMLLWVGGLVVLGVLARALPSGR